MLYFPWFGAPTSNAITFLILICLLFIESIIWNEVQSFHVNADVKP